MALALFVALGLTAEAQGPDYPAVEIFGGYSLSHQQDGANINGWHGQAAFNINENFGIVADVSHHQMGRMPGVIGIGGLTDVRLISYTVGPRATNRSLDPWSIYVQALFGQSRLTGQADIGGGVTEQQVTRPFTLTMGGGLDYELTDRVSVRVVEIDYRLLRIMSSSSSGVRFSTGVNFKF